MKQIETLPVKVHIAGDVNTAPSHDLLGKRLPDHQIEACLDGDERRAFFLTEDYHKAKRLKRFNLERSVSWYAMKLRNSLQRTPGSSSAGLGTQSQQELYRELDRCETKELKFKYFVGLDRFAGLTTGVRRKLQSSVSADDREVLDFMLLRMNSNQVQDQDFQEELLKRLLDDLHFNHGISWNRIRSSLADVSSIQNFADIRNRILQC